MEKRHGDYSQEVFELQPFFFKWYANDYVFTFDNASIGSFTDIHFVLLRRILHCRYQKGFNNLLYARGDMAYMKNVGALKNFVGLIFKEGVVIIMR